MCGMGVEGVITVAFVFKYNRLHGSWLEAVFGSGYHLDHELKLLVMGVVSEQQCKPHTIQDTSGY